jgi:hypothetical protein
VAGVCQPYLLAVLLDMDRPNTLVVPGDGWVYYSDYDAPSLVRVKDGAQHQVGTPVIADTSDSIATLVVDGTDVYYGTNADPTKTPIYHSDTSGMTPSPFMGFWQFARWMVFDADNLYFTVAPGQVIRMSRSAGSFGSILAIAGGNFYGLASDSTYLYVTDYAHGTIVRQTKAASILPGADAGPFLGGANGSIVLDDTSFDPFPIVVDATYVYWADLTGIYRKSKDGVGMRDQLATFFTSPSTMINLQAPWSLSLTGDRIFYAVPGGGPTDPTGVVGSVSITPDGGAPEIVATGQSGSLQVVATPTAVYWMAQSDSEIWKVVR